MVAGTAMGEVPEAKLDNSDLDSDWLHLDGLLPEPAEDSSRLLWLWGAFGLFLFDVELILISLAPELDQRYERLYAYLLGCASHPQPSVDLALNLLCPDAAARLERGVHFDADAPIIRNGLIRLIHEPELVADPVEALVTDIDFIQALRLAFRYDSLCSMVLYLDGLDVICHDSQPVLYDQLLEALEQHSGISILAGSQPWRPARRHELGLKSLLFALSGVPTAKPRGEVTWTRWTPDSTAAISKPSPFGQFTS
jgi:hypothetical protein